MIKHERTNVYDFNFQLVWVTKYRKPIFTTDERITAMKAILTEIAERNTVEIANMDVLPDQIHLLISFPPKLAPSSIVKAFKGGSAKQWFIQFPETKPLLWNGHLWSSSFFMSTLGNVSKEVVRQYINSQLDQYNGGRPRR
ncbi:IS200/IS605 family transposase [Secundilactobacillus hailunensis]|uniref:IS200/IS605 family transposase n=1 Tax=Secundilactobacillus hailunensis TaxID=2559923 RepID=A0ABW1T6X4_9LACO|nr:IS200/IS605 family transposase [Secundilactobacillus hailunensis]